jgi:hypothetical protein
MKGHEERWSFCCCSLLRNSRSDRHEEFKSSPFAFTPDFYISEEVTLKESYRIIPQNECSQ